MHPMAIDGKTLEEMTAVDDRVLVDQLVVDVDRPAVITLPEAQPEPLGSGYLKLWLATAISNIGDGARLTALPLLAASVTRDPIAISALLFSSKLPWLLLSLHSGAIADRVDRRKLIVGVNLLRALVMGLLVLSTMAGGISLPVLYAVALAQGIGEVFSDNAAFALLPTLVPRSRLEDANGRLEAAVIVSNEFAGPAIGGLLFVIAASLPFSLDAVSFLLAGALVFSLAPRGSLKAASEKPKTTIRQDIAEGLRFMWSHTVLRNLSLIAAVTNLVLFATFSIQVLFFLDVLGLPAATFGLLLSAEACGAMAGSLLAGRMRKRFGLAPTIVVALGIAAGANLVIAGTTSWLLVGAMALAVSVGGGVWNVVTNSFRQSIVPDRLLGRVQSSHRVLSWGAMPVGTILGGLLSDVFGLRAPFLVAGIVLCVLAALVGTVVSRHGKMVPAEAPA